MRSECPGVAARLAAAMAMVCTVGCGDPLVGEDYLGTPLFEVHGGVQRVSVGREPADHGEVRLSLFWIGFDSASEQRDVVEQRTDLDPALAGFSMAAFDAPPEEALTFDGGTAAVGIALIVLYADGNANEQLNAAETPETGPDVLLGASETHVVAYADRPVTDGSPAAAILGTVGPGFHLFENSGAHTCPFTSPDGCDGRGALTAVEPEAANVVLTLHDDARAVRVPNPEVPRRPPGSGTSSGDADPPSNLYDGETARRGTDDPT